ncbi:MAG: DUF4127 family protein, partial [bacterium]|nr:DUF4127 family protein [bacterium]
MRIALLPLDSRPPSWQFPQRIAAIAHNEVVSPPREMLGTLHNGAYSRELLDWLKSAAGDANAAVISWDALVYGGLVQSRAEGNPLPIAELRDALSTIDWSRCAGYLWLTVPRLGMTVSSWEQWELHKRIAEYFTLWGKLAESPDDDQSSRKLHKLELQIGAETLAKAWSLRQRNHDYAQEALRISADLGLRTCHVASEDNARSGPHIGEVAALQKLSLELTVETKRNSPNATLPRYTFFDGADECGSLLTARAILDDRNAGPLPVRLTLFPSVPTPDKYFGLYESHSLEDGLHFLAKFLGLEFRAKGKAQWLVCFGKQPQPDVFAENLVKVFSNALLLPPVIEGNEPLFLADLQACNGGNLHLVRKVAEIAGDRLRCVSAWNTNFNALGFSAAALAMGTLDDADSEALKQLLLERVADDYVYQSVVRGVILDKCDEYDDCGIDPLDFTTGAINPDRLPDVTLDQLLKLLSKDVFGHLAWGFGSALKRLGFTADQVMALKFSFPWDRA